MSTALPRATIRRQVRLPLQFADGYTTTARALTFDGLADGLEHLALGLGDGQVAIERSTILGPVSVHRIDVSESILADLAGVDDPQHGCVRFSACTWLFSSTQRTIARSGGFRYKPTMSRTFSTNCGSLENLKFSTR